MEEATTDPQTRLLIDDPSVDEKEQPKQDLKKKASESDDATFAFEMPFQTAAGHLRREYGVPPVGNIDCDTAAAFGRVAA